MPEVGRELWVRVDTQQVVRLADEFGLPLDIATETIGVLTKRRDGKSYLARNLNRAAAAG